MSKLVELLESSNYARLNVLSGHSPNNPNAKNFSVKLQSDDVEDLKQQNATDFLDLSGTFQSGFTVLQSKNTLSITGRRKANGNEYTRFTKTAQEYYDDLANDPNLKNYGPASKLVQKYLATKSEAQYKTINEAASGVVLVYNPA